MKTCPKCGKTYNDTWRMCLDCKAELKEAVDLTQEQGEQLIKVIDSIDDAIANATGDIKAVLADGHTGIEETQNLCKELMEEIKPEYERGDVAAVHVYYIINGARTWLLQVDMCTLVEIQHSDNHKEGCGIILDMLKVAHESISTKENIIEALSKSRSRKVRSIANRVGHCFDEYHKALYFIEKSIKNALKWKEKNKK